jgi:hypothetical protein
MNLSANPRALSLWIIHSLDFIGCSRVVMSACGVSSGASARSTRQISRRPTPQLHARVETHPRLALLAVAAPVHDEPLQELAVAGCARLVRQTEARRCDAVTQLLELPVEALHEPMGEEHQLAVLEAQVGALRVGDARLVTPWIDCEDARRVLELRPGRDLREVAVSREVGLHARKIAVHQLGWLREREEQGLPVNAQRGGPRRVRFALDDAPVARDAKELVQLGPHGTGAARIEALAQREASSVKIHRARQRRVQLALEADRKPMRGAATTAGIYGGGSSAPSRYSTRPRAARRSGGNLVAAHPSCGSNQSTSRTMSRSRSRSRPGARRGSAPPAARLGAGGALRVVRRQGVQERAHPLGREVAFVRCAASRRDKIQEHRVFDRVVLVCRRI